MNLPYRQEWLEGEARFLARGGIARAAEAWRLMRQDAAHPLAEIAAALRADPDAALRSEAEALLDGASDILFIGMGGSIFPPSLFLPFASDGGGGGGVRFHIWSAPEPRLAEQIFARLAQNPKGARLVVLSRSGGTMESCAMARAAHDYLSPSFPKGRVAGAAFSVPGRSPLRDLSERYGWRHLDMSAGINSRFSLFTRGGLFPALLMGLDEAALRAAADKIIGEADRSEESQIIKGAAFSYAMREKPIHVLCAHGGLFRPLGLWWRQIWAESLARGGAGFTPIFSECPTDQHSQFQLYLDGPDDKAYTQLVLGDGGGGGGGGGGEDSYPELSRVMAKQKKIAAKSLMERGRPLRRLALLSPSAEAMTALVAHFMLETFLMAALLERSPFGQESVDAQKRDLQKMLE